MEKNNEIKPIGLRDDKGRFLKGAIANPTGRPKKGTALTDVMSEILESDPLLKEKIIRKLLDGAVNGDISFIREVLDRIDGKPHISAEVHNTGEVVVVPNEVYQRYNMEVEIIEDDNGVSHNTADSSNKQGEV